MDRHTWLKELRTKAGLTQKEVAAACDVTPETIGNLEGARGSTGLGHGTTLMKVLELYGAVEEDPDPELSPFGVRLANIESMLEEALTLLRSGGGTESLDRQLGKAGQTLGLRKAGPLSSPADRPKEAS